jgi:murein DD-endopeptidase MepM/ murein hydrolase activator NlpD
MIMNMGKLSITLFFLGLASSTHAEQVEFNQIARSTFVAPLAVTPVGTKYFPTIIPVLWLPHAAAKPWGSGTFFNMPIPSISFNADDDKGTTAYCAGKFPKHLGTDYAGPEGTPVYAIADGIIVRGGLFTTDSQNKVIGDAYLVVESGSNDRWTTTYGHLVNTPAAIGKTVKKGDLIGRLFNFRYAGDIPHLHLAIHKGRYDSTSSAVKGFACATEAQYKTNFYNFISPETLKYESKYY